MTRLTTRMLICISLWLGASPLHIAYAQDADEDERLFKAAFIFNFAKFTRWPETAQAQQNEPLILCTAGRDELIVDLKRLGGRIIRSRPVTIVALRKVPDPGNCHLLYIATSEHNRYASILASVRGKSVLSISEVPGFAGNGGIIELYRKAGKTSFIINLKLAREAGLELSSRLLNLAVVLEHEEAP